MTKNHDRIAEYFTNHEYFDSVVRLGEALEEPSVERRKVDVGMLKERGNLYHAYNAESTK